MTQTQLQTMLQLHKQALEYLERIQLCKDSMKRCQDNMVDIEKTPNLPRSSKELFLDQYLDTLNQWRDVHSFAVARYADTMRELVEPYLPISEDNGATYLITTYELVRQ